MPEIIMVIEDRSVPSLFQQLKWSSGDRFPQHVFTGKTVRYMKNVKYIGKWSILCLADGSTTSDLLLNTCQKKQVVQAFESLTRLLADFRG